MPPLHSLLPGPASRPLLMTKSWTTPVQTSTRTTRHPTGRRTLPLSGGPLMSPLVLLLLEARVRQRDAAPVVRKAIPEPRLDPPEQVTRPVDRAEAPLV